MLCPQTAPYTVGIPLKIILGEGTWDKTGEQFPPKENSASVFSHALFLLLSISLSSRLFSDCVLFLSNVFFGFVLVFSPC